VKKADVERKPRKQLTAESAVLFENKVFTGFVCCPTCFSFLKIPLSGQIDVKQTEESRC
jgi:hypothetical protein